MNIIDILQYPFLKSLGLALGIIIVFFILRKPIVNLIFKIFEKITRKTKTKADDKLLSVIRRPLRMLVTFTVFYFTYKLIDFNYVIEMKTLLKIDGFVYHVYRSVIIIFFFMILYNMTGESHVLFDELSTIFDIEVDKLLIPFVSKVFRLLIFVICIAVVAADWGFDVNGFVAGLGLGGLAFALAAQDTLANTFGGAVIITEKPFTIGDWIIVDGVEGTVEDINFRSTQIRKFDKSIVTVPNSKIAKSNIINYSKRDIRRISYDLKLRIETPVDKIKAVVATIENMLIEHEDINNETIFVKFNSFGDSSLNLFLYFFTNTSVWGEYLSIAEDINLRILDILSENEVELAVPMQVVKVEKESIS